MNQGYDTASAIVEQLRVEMEQARDHVRRVSVERGAISVAQADAADQRNVILADNLTRAWERYDQDVMQPALRAFASTVDAYYAAIRRFNLPLPSDSTR